MLLKKVSSFRKMGHFLTKSKIFQNLNGSNLFRKFKFCQDKEIILLNGNRKVRH